MNASIKELRFPSVKAATYKTILKIQGEESVRLVRPCNLSEALNKLAADYEVLVRNQSVSVALPNKE